MRKNNRYIGKSYLLQVCKEAVEEGSDYYDSDFLVECEKKK